MRFWMAQGGKADISEKDINEVDTSNLRDIESFMTQETHLFHDSIKNNLRIAKRDATDAEIEAVILKSLREGQDGKTVALVSHRRSTMRIADAVYSVESLSRTGRSS